jgi:hypothetical protein
MSLSVRASSLAAIPVAAVTSNSPQTRPSNTRCQKLSACAAGLLCVGVCCLAEELGPGPDYAGSGPLIAYTTLPISIPEAATSLSIPDTTLPGFAPEASASKIPGSETATPSDAEAASLWISGPAAEGSFENFALADERQMEMLLKTSPREGREFVLLRKKMPSRYAYDSWANVKTGYGRFFPDEAIARSRTSGVGVEDPDWIYIKMTFRF